MSDQSDDAGPSQRLFGSSLCGMFGGSQASKTDACALAFCGIWLWERNRFLLTGETPRAWSERPVDVGIVFLLGATALVWSLDPNNVFLSLSLVVMAGCFLWKLFEFQHERSVFRQQLAVEEYRRMHDDGTFRRLIDSGGDPQDDPGLMLFLGQHEREVYGDGAHALCGCANASRNPPEAPGIDGRSEDFCFRLWRLTSNFCCGVLCSCYVQCFGMCAIAQEHRHLKHRLPPDPVLWQVDYITFEPWTSYFPAIVRLRMSHEGRFLPHARAMSILSSRLVKSVFVFLVLATGSIMLPVHFPRWQILILYGTLVQPLAILFFVHWLWHRLDLSLDAVVKYFASGFFLCTSICMLYEMVVSALTSILIFLVSLLGMLGLLLAGEIDADEMLAEADGSDDRVGSQRLAPMGYMISITLLTAFLNAFLVAALVEEIGKYLCFWMVEHPDMENDKALFLPPMDSLGAEDLSVPLEGEKSKLQIRDQNSRPTPCEPIKVPAPSLVSRGSAITIAMVTTALGFACAENLLYVFVYSPPGLDQEISTLIIRCLFPIHPLAAGLQSIGVVKRDIERDRSSQVGRIIYPGWILHGSFDFALMAYSQIAALLSPEEGTTEAPKSDDESEVEVQTSACMVSMVMLIPLIGMLFYYRSAWAQRDRLEALDRERGAIV